MLTYASFFGGLGGFELALDAAGFRRVFSCEIDRKCREVFRARYGKEPEWDDVSTLDPARIPDADVWVAGPPCQDLSVAGRRAGLGGRRSGLFHRLVELVAARRPLWILLEQVPGLLSNHEGRDMEAWINALAKLGYLGAWRIADAQFVGVPQRRRRVFTLGRLGAGGGPQILHLAEGCQRHPAAGDGEGEDASEGVGGGTGVVGCLGGRGNGGHDDNDAQGGHLVAPAVMSRQGKGAFTDPVNDGLVAAPVRSNPYNNSDAGMEAKSYVVHENKSGSATPNPRAAALRSGASHSYQIAVAPIRSRQSSPGVSAPGRGGEDDENLVLALSTDITPKSGKVAFTLKQPSPSGGGQPQAVVAPAVTATYSRTGNERQEAERLVHQSMSIRRLTPTECERLQGFPDGWTCRCGVCPDCPSRRVPPWVDPTTFTLGGCGHSVCGCKCPDGPRYRMLGNAVAVPVVRRIADWLVAYLLDGR